MTLAPNVMRMPTFLLVQHGAVLVCDSLPRGLHTHKLKEWQGFKVAIGCTGKDGERHVAGIVVDVAPLWGAETWAVSYGVADATTVCAHDSIISYVLYYLDKLLSDGCLYDMLHLPAPLTIKPIYTVRNDCTSDATDWPSA